MLQNNIKMILENMWGEIYIISYTQVAKDLFDSDEIPVEYWEQLAEQRREALAEALQENQEVKTNIAVPYQAQRNVEKCSCAATTTYLNYL